MEKGKGFKSLPPPPPLDTGFPDSHDFIFIKEVDITNGPLSRGVGVGVGGCHTRRLVLGGRRGVKVTRYYNIILLTYLRSELIFIKQYRDSMCFSSIFSLKLRII